MLKLNATKELLDGSLPIINLFVSIVFSFRISTDQIENNLQVRIQT